MTRFRAAGASSAKLLALNCVFAVYFDVGVVGVVGCEIDDLFYKHSPVLKHANNTICTVCCCYVIRLHILCVFFFLHSFVFCTPTSNILNGGQLPVNAAVEFSSPSAWALTRAAPTDATNATPLHWACHLRRVLVCSTSLLIFRAYEREQAHARAIPTPKRLN